MVNGMPPLPEEINATIMQLWQDMQTELEGLSSNSTRYTAIRSDHGVPVYEPRLVVDAIRHVVDEYRAQAGIVVPPAPEQIDAASHVPVITGITERKEWENGKLVIIEAKLGRDVLVQTISGGYEAFVRTYNAVADEEMKILWSATP